MELLNATRMAAGYTLGMQPDGRELLVVAVKGTFTIPQNDPEETGRPVTNPRENYRPMAFGPIGRAWEPRPKLAGTYDGAWLDNVFPFLPADFQEDYYQAAPADQQMPHPGGGVGVVLINLTPAGRTTFQLPEVAVPVSFFLRDEKEREVEATVDPVIIEPDSRRFLMTWRASLPLRRNLFEVSRVIVGRMSPGWYRARAVGKTYYRSLRELVNSRRRVAR